MEIDKSGWSGEGEFTAFCLEALESIEGLDLVRVEDAPATRADAGFNFVSNEIYVRAPAHVRRERIRMMGLLVWSRRVREPAMTIEQLAARLTTMPTVGAPDFTDESMIQYLRTERIVPPYQTRGIKIVEMVRIYLLPD